MLTALLLTAPAASAAAEGLLHGSLQGGAAVAVLGAAAGCRNVQSAIEGVVFSPELGARVALGITWRGFTSLETRPWIGYGCGSLANIHYLEQHLGLEYVAGPVTLDVYAMHGFQFPLVGVGADVAYRIPESRWFVRAGGLLTLSTTVVMDLAVGFVAF